MKLGRNILIALGSLFLVLACVLGFTLSRITFHDFARLEREDAGTGRAARAQRSTSSATTSGKLSDWSNWDDTRTPARLPNPAYVKSNISAEALGSLRLDALVILNRRGDLVLSCSAETTGGKDRRGAEGPARAAGPHRLSPRPRTEDGKLSGIVLLGAAPDARRGAAYPHVAITPGRQPARSCSRYLDAAGDAHARRAHARPAHGGAVRPPWRNHARGTHDRSGP